MADIRIPKVGMSAVEVEIIDIPVKLGQKVVPGDPVADVGADKADITIESDIRGVVMEVLASPGDVCEVGQVIVRVEEQQ